MGGPISIMKIFSLFIIASVALAQGPSQARIVVHPDPIEKVAAKPGTTVRVSLKATIEEGFHVNSDKPNDPYLIPLKLTWNPGALEKPSLTYPKPETAKLPFSQKPVTIYTGSFVVETQFKVASNAKPGPSEVTGKLRFQACNDHECLIPRTLDVTVPVEITK